MTEDFADIVRAEEKKRKRKKMILALLEPTSAWGLLNFSFVMVTFVLLGLMLWRGTFSMKTLVTIGVAGVVFGVALLPALLTINLWNARKAS